MLQYRYDTQMLIDGDNLDEDKIHDYILNHFDGDCLLAVGGDGDPIKFTSIPTSRGRFWNMEDPSARSMILLSKIWIVRQEDSRAEQVLNDAQEHF